MHVNAEYFAIVEGPLMMVVCMQIITCFVRFRKVLIGSMSVNSYNYPAEHRQTSPPYLLHHAGLVNATSSGDLCRLSPEKGNIHEIKANQ